MIGRSLPWTSQDNAILADIYPREGLNGAADLLPDRSWHAIEQRAFKLGLKSPIVSDAPSPKLAGEKLEQAIRHYEQDGWSFMKIGREFGVCATAATNAVLIALCPRRGYRPAERDASGRMTTESKERLRYMLKKGLRGVEIQLRLGLSAARVAEERRRYAKDLASRDKAPLPPPGAGEQYSGALIPRAKKLKVEAILLDGHGSTTAARRAGVSVPSAKNIRRRLIARLARKGEVLPGCDDAGNRIAAAKHSDHYIPASLEAELRRRLLAGDPVQPAARATGIGSCGAYRIRDRLAAELRERGEELPKPIRLGPGSERRVSACGDDWLPADRVQEFRRLAHAVGFEEAKATIVASVAAQLAKEAEVRAAERARPKSFEEQLARIARGEARVVPAFTPRRPDPTFTLGGVATGAL